ncbi:hypothetical protein GCM10010206_77000 [Streptomyces cinerochromogenes]|nr:hypothetical protein [Streptomyces cinerochromogenes]GGT02965.1 hypothetical protein GCM10010206_77000 [Streptomyces cinerochromogenes]
MNQPEAPRRLGALTTAQADAELAQTADSDLAQLAMPDLIPHAAHGRLAHPGFPGRIDHTRAARPAPVRP